MNEEEIKQLAEKELVNYLKGHDFGLCPSSKNYMADHIEEILKSANTTKELEQKLEQTEKDLADYQFNYPTIKELEQTNNKLLDVINNQDVKIADLEKEVKNLEWQLQEVVKDNDYYQAENKSLEQQIEQMKVCEICEYGGNVGRLCYSNELCNNKDKWKLSHRFLERKEYRK